MKTYKIKVSYFPLFAEDGTVYKKRFSVPSCVAVAFSDACLAESARKKDYYHSYLLGQPLTIQRNKKGLNPYILMNVTQTHYFKDWASKNENINMNNKRASYEANGWLAII